MTTSSTWRAWAFAGLSAVAAAAQASTVTLASGSQFNIADPAGTGRTASLYFLGGTGELAFSNTGFDGVDATTLGGLISALNVGHVGITGLGGAVVTEGLLSGPGSTRVSSSVATSVATIAMDDVTGAVQTVGSVGGALQTGTFISGTLTGGSAGVTNLRFDLVNKTVIADLHGVRDAVGTKAAVTYDLPNATLWTFDSITGPTALKAEYLLAADPVAALTAAGFTVIGASTAPGNISPNFMVAAQNEITGLRITTAGFNFFKNSLGLGTPGINALAAVNNDVPVLDANGDPTGEVLRGGYGTVRSTIYFGTVPEPSTYALMGLGLVGVALAVRRRRG